MSNTLFRLIRGRVYMAVVRNGRRAYQRFIGGPTNARAAERLCRQLNATVARVPHMRG